MNGKRGVINRNAEKDVIKEITTDTVKCFLTQLNIDEVTYAKGSQRHNKNS